MRSLMIIILGLLAQTSVLAGDFTLKSSAFNNNEKIPILYTCDGQNISPPLSWTNAPANTESFVLIVASPDWGPHKVYLWTLYNLPSDNKNLKEGANKHLPEETLVGKTFYNDAKYYGPCPPDNLLHHYVYTLYAINTKLMPIDAMDPDELLTKIKPNILKTAELRGSFSH